MIAQTGSWQAEPELAAPVPRAVLAPPPWANPYFLGTTGTAVLAAAMFLVLRSRGQGQEWAAGGFLAAAAAVMALLGWRHHRRIVRLLSTGAVASATVIELKRPVNYKAIDRACVVSYSHAGQPVTTTVRAPLHAEWPAGARVTVLVDPARPSRALVYRADPYRVVPPALS